MEKCYLSTRDFAMILGVSRVIVIRRIKNGWFVAYKDPGIIGRERV